VSATIPESRSKADVEAPPVTRPPAHPPTPSRGGWLPTGLTLLVLLLGLASAAGLHQNDEDLYAGIAQSMYRAGSWIVPSYLGEVDFHKPPLLYWMMLLAMQVLGPTVFAARLPVALCGARLVWSTYRLTVEGLRLPEGTHPTAGGPEQDTELASGASEHADHLPDPEQVGGLAAGLCATSLGFFVYARTGMTDIPLVLALVESLRGWLELRAGVSSGAWRIAVCAALAFLLKGPVGVVILALSGSLWWLLAPADSRPSPGSAPPLKHRVPALLTGLALMALWPSLLALRGLGRAWFDSFILGENLGKFQDTHNPLSGMLAGYAGLLAPWTLLALASLVDSLRPQALRSPLRRLLLCFCGSCLLVYALPAIKWAQYLLPCTPALAVLSALALSRPPSRLLRVAATVTGLVLALAALPLLVAPRLFGEPPTGYLLLTSAACCLVGGWFLLGARAVEAAVLTSFVAQGCLALAAPHLSPDQLPGELASTVAHREVVVYRLPAERYSNALGYRARSCTRPEELRQAFEAGAVLVVSNSDLAELAAERAIDTERMELLLCWNRWRKGLSWTQVQTALQVGTTRPLLENLNVVCRTSPLH
jgi:4-amino-4-deoxy-L-arabinose transferase-like glycosyltransferase